MMLDNYDIDHTIDDNPVFSGIGKLDALHSQLADLGCKGQDWALLIFAGDNGISREGLSHYPALQSARIVNAHLTGISPTARLLKRLGKHEWIFDLGLWEDIDDPGLIRQKIRRGTRNFLYEDALEQAEVWAALEAGKAAWLRVKDCAYDMIGLGEIGIGDTLCASALAITAMDLPVQSMAGPGSGGPEVIEKKAQLIKAAMERRAPDPLDVVDMLARFGGLEIAALIGFISQGAETGMPFMLDGFVTSVAALLASILNNKCYSNLFCPSLSMEPGHRLILERLQIRPWFDLELNYGEGLASVLGLFLAEVTMSFYQ